MNENFDSKFNALIDKYSELLTDRHRPGPLGKDTILGALYLHSEIHASTCETLE